MFKQFIKSVLAKPKFDSLIEGLYADQYTNNSTRSEIAHSYHQRWAQPKTPLTHPELFDPLQPPQGWRYDPYYECWIEIGK